MHAYDPERILCRPRGFDLLCNYIFIIHVLMYRTIDVYVYNIICMSKIYYIILSDISFITIAKELILHCKADTICRTVRNKTLCTHKKKKKNY